MSNDGITTQVRGALKPLAPCAHRAGRANLPLWSRRADRGACSTKMPPLRSHKRRRVACQHFPDDQTLRLQAGAGEDDVIHLPSGLDCVDCERQEEEEAPALESWELDPSQHPVSCPLSLLLFYLPLLFVSAFLAHSPVSFPTTLFNQHSYLK